MNVDWSAAALADLDRFAAFLHEHFPELAGIVAEAIIDRVALLAENPRLGRPIAGNDAYREVVLRVLKVPYVFQYRIDGERLVILRVRHGREAR